MKWPRKRSMGIAGMVLGMIGVPVVLYVLGLPTLGGAFVLSDLIVFVVAAIQTGELSPHWLAHQSASTIRRAAGLEMSKALVLGGLLVDMFGGGVGYLVYELPSSQNLNVTIALGVMGVLVRDWRLSDAGVCGILAYREAVKFAVWDQREVGR